MLPNTLKMSMEQYLRLMDHDIERRLAGFVSNDRDRQTLWTIIAAEEDRVAGYEREFPCEFRLTIMPQVAYRPCMGLHLSYKIKVEGEAERAHEVLKHKLALFKFGGPIHKPIHHPGYC